MCRITKKKMCHYYMETQDWYKNNNHDPGTCALIFNKKDGNYCPRHICENHRDSCGGVLDCKKCENDGIYENRYFDESKAWGDIIEIPEIKKKKKSKKKKKLWITINPPDRGYTESTFINKIQKMMYGRNPINSGWWAFEWGNDNRPNKGIHCHIYIHEGDHRRVKFWVKRNFKEEYKKCEQCLDFKNPPDEWMNDKLEYVGGITYDEKKDIKKKKDIDKRNMFNLQNVYYKNFVTF